MRKVKQNKCPFGCADPNCKLTIEIALNNSKPLKQTNQSPKKK
jgi:hypothetical protein